MKNKVTILVNSCDEYSDLWEAFFSLLKKYWPDCPCRIILNTESKTFTYDGLNIECFQLYQLDSKVAYGERILKHLNKITTEYTLMLLDDFFLRDFIKVHKILECLQWMDSNDKIVSFQFSSLLDKNNIVSCKYDGFEKRPEYGLYKLCFSPALWRTSKLMSYWRKHENPWQWEEIGNIRTVKHKEDEFYSICEGVPPIIDYGYNKNRCWGVVQGKWAKDNVERLFEENDIKIDYSQRGVFSETDRLRLCKQSYLKKWIDEFKSLKGTGLEFVFLKFKMRRLIQTIYMPWPENWCSYFLRKGV